MGTGTLGTKALSINDQGQIVGLYQDASNVIHGFLYSGGTYTTLDPAGSAGTLANGINNAGQVVGFYLDAQAHGHGFLETTMPNPPPPAGN